MIKIFSLVLFLSTLLTADVEISGHADLDSQFYLTKPDAKHQNSFTAKQTLELKYTKETMSVYGKLYAQEAYRDALDVKNDTKRTFVRLDELFLRFDFEDEALQIGKSIKYWGALELRNIVDAFNPNEQRDDMFETNKLGVWNTSYTYYTENGEFSCIVKVAEPDQKMAAYPYVYYVFPLAVKYNDNLLTSSNESRPSVYLTYSGTTDSEYALDYAFIYENGYDSQRYFSSLINQRTSYVQNAYLVNKFMTYNTLVLGATLFKLEALYAFVEDDVGVGDYSHVAFGIEHTLDDFENSASLGLIAEYYKYDTYESDKYNDLQLFETMQDDLFLGMRYTFNDADDSAIVGGVIRDLEYKEEVYYLEYESRFSDNIKVDLDYYYIEPSKNTQTAYSLLGRHQRVALNIAYHF